MNYDVGILVSWAGGLGIFGIIHILHFRCINRRSLRELIWHLGIAAVIGLISSWIAVTFFFREGTVLLKVLSLFLETILVGLSIAIYILGIITMIDSSIHVLFLTILKEGMTKRQWKRQVTIKSLLSPRLKRVVESEDVVHKNGTYRLAKRHSTMRLRQWIVRLTEMLVQ